MRAEEPAKADDCHESIRAELRVVSEHPWRPPFGLDRVGRPLRVQVEVNSPERPYREYWLNGYVAGKEVASVMISLVPSPDATVFKGEGTFEVFPEEVALFARCRFEGKPTEIVRKKIEPPGFEAEAMAQATEIRNPVDLGTILVPHDWLLLVGGQQADVSVAVLDRSKAIEKSTLTAWYDAVPQQKVSKMIDLLKGQRGSFKLVLPPVPADLERTTCEVSLTGQNGRVLWKKSIQTMVVGKEPQWPRFGAVETRLRYDAPISVRDPRTGSLSSMDYGKAWKPELKDVVVFLPNGSRFVFWRGSSYIPFWVSKYNTGVSYEWAETVPPPDGFTDSVEPLMDKELRYGRVEILESTVARVHVRWTYQSNDFNYKVWGDSPSEDFIFYPDGYGTRVLTLRNAPGARYEVLEYIVLTPQGAFPFEVLNPRTADILFLDGEKREIKFPGPNEKPSSTASFSRASGLGPAKEIPAIYRVRFHKDDDAGAISFNPIDTHLPQYLFSPFYDRGVMVTPFYWGSHWPLARGNSTGWAIDDRISLTPAHNSVLGWGLERQTEASIAKIQTIDTLGQSKLLYARRWTWLIGMNDDSDARLLEWARSFSKPPSIELRGARLDAESYVSERRAVRLAVEGDSLGMTVKDGSLWINPVFELSHAPKNIAKISVGGKVLDSKDYAWDTKVLWLRANVQTSTPVEIQFTHSQE
jgi:hypothetical protein